MSLLYLARKHGTDKESAHGYISGCYSRFLEGDRAWIKPGPVRLLELGVFGGASMRMWREFYPEGELTCVDLIPEEVVRAGGTITFEHPGGGRPITLRDVPGLDTSIRYIAGDAYSVDIADRLRATRTPPGNAVPATPLPAVPAASDAHHVGEPAAGLPRVDGADTDAGAANAASVGDVRDHQYAYDLIIDDGPHTPASQIWCLQYYYDLLAPGGLLFIEDIATPATAAALREIRRPVFIMDKSWKLAPDSRLMVWEKTHD